MKWLTISPRSKPKTPSIIVKNLDSFFVTMHQTECTLNPLRPPTDSSLLHGFVHLECLYFNELHKNCEQSFYIYI